MCVFGLICKLYTCRIGEEDESHVSPFVTPPPPIILILGKISARTPPIINFRVRIRVRFRIRIRLNVWFRFRVRVKGRARVGMVLGCNSLHRYMEGYGQNSFQNSD